jgi:hypothetical protein
MSHRLRGKTGLIAALQKMEGTGLQKLELITKLKAAGLLTFEDPEEIMAAEVALHGAVGADPRKR